MRDLDHDKWNVRLLGIGYGIEAIPQDATGNTRAEIATANPYIMFPLAEYLTLVGKLRSNEKSVYMKNSMYYSHKACKELKFENLTLKLENDLKFVIPDEFWKKDLADGGCKIMFQMN